MDGTSSSTTTSLSTRPTVPAPGDDLVGVLVRREDGIERLRDRACLDDERDPLVERRALELERRQAKRAAEAQLRVRDDRVRDVVPLGELHLVVECLGR
jgi:hypothetical protein